MSIGHSIRAHEVLKKAQSLEAPPAAARPQRYRHRRAKAARIVNVRRFEPLVWSQVD
jgi:hypothetical protein